MKRIMWASLFCALLTGPAAAQFVSPSQFLQAGDIDDTASWQRMCAAISAAGTGWIVADQGKTYTVFSSTAASFNQDKLCLLSNVSGLRLDMNGAKITSAYYAQLVIGGSSTNGD